MQTLYRLLRNNVQSGPFTIDELLQQQLQHTDLIWIEGKSHAWSPLSDMELKPFEETPVVAAHIQEPQLPIPINEPLPLDLEERAEAIKRRALSYTTPYQLHRVDDKEEKLTSSFATEKIDFVDHRRERYSQAVEVVGAALVALLVIGGVAGGRYLIREKKEPVNSVTTLINAGESNAAKAVPAKNQVAAVPETPVKDTVQMIKPLLVKAKKRDTPTRNKTIALPLEAMVSSPKKADEVTVDQTALPASADPPRQKEIVTVASNTSAGEEKKKSLGQALKGLFKKKKRSEDASDLKTDKDE
jgi:hypothetical protein